MRARAGYLTLLTASALSALTAAAQGAIPFQPLLRDFVHTAWTQHDGIPLSSIRTISQTTDGYLWIVSDEEGLLRFDGVRFVPQESPCAPIKGIVDAQSDGAGGLYIECAYQIFHRDRSGRTVLVNQNLVPSTLRPAMSFFVDRQRKLWLWGKSLGYLRPDGSVGTTIPGTERPRDARYCVFAEDSDGNLWFGTQHGLMRIRDDRAEWVLTGLVLAVAPAHSGGVYALRRDSIVHAGAGPVTTADNFSRDVTTGSGHLVVETPAGIWLGTSDRGVALFRHGQSEFFGRREGLSSVDVDCVFLDSEGSVWIGTGLGLHRFREPLAYLMSEADGVPPGQPYFVYRDSRNGLWLGSYGKTVRIDRDSGRRLTLESTYYCIGEERDGPIWLASEDDLGYLRDNRFIAVRDSTGARIPGVRSLHSDGQSLWALSVDTGLYKVVDHRPELQIPVQRSFRLLASAMNGIWISLGSKLLRSMKGEQTIFGAEAGLLGETILTIQEYNGSIWIGASKGLSRWRNGRWTTWTVKEGLPGQGYVSEITADSEGRLWMMTEGGILMMDQRQLDQTPDGEPRQFAYLRIGKLDHVSPDEGGSLTSPRVTTDASGRLFFATSDSFAVVDPARFVEQSLAPRIVLETVLVNRRPVSAGSGARFVEPQDLQFEYTSLSLRNPENVRFRYRLEGHDPDWIEAGSLRRATYGSLKPGSYRFRVNGSGSEGVWNNQGASYAFQIALPFYKTYPFLCAVGLTILTLAWLLYRYRVQLVTERVRLRLEAQSDERLRIAQEMHDSLLQGIHSASLTLFVVKENMDLAPSESRQLLDRALEILGHSTDQARKMVSSLRAASPVRQPLMNRLNSLVAEETALYPAGPKVSIECSGSPRDLQPAVDKDVYLIASEALKNALRHAGARHIQISVQFEPSRFQVAIADDGVGISKEIKDAGREGHFGLQGIRERAARHSALLKIDCPQAGGTKLTLSVEGNLAYAR